VPSETEILPLIRTKLYRPRITADLVRWLRLLERLEARRGRPLALVSAPAGYGKTTLVSTWLETCECPRVWITLDEGAVDALLHRIEGWVADMRLVTLSLRHRGAWTSARPAWVAASCA
jgi:LuxR family maltose regulon positive regulatory protein